MADFDSQSSRRWDIGQSDWSLEDTSTDYQTEVEEWIELNKKLKHHGLPGIKLLHPADVTLLAGRTISFDSPISKVLRENLTTLMADCDHRQTLIQDLILTNNKLKDDLEKQAALTEKYHGKTKELQILLESSRSMVKELEQEESFKSSFYAGEEEKLLTTKNAIHAKCKHLQHKCQSQEKEIERLKQKMQKITEEEDKKAKRHAQVFQEFKKRTARAHNIMDDKLLDVIDAYETQIKGLQQELDYQRSGTYGDSKLYDEEYSSLSTGTSQNFKSIIKLYEKQLSEAKKKNRKLEEEIELVKLDMGSRPGVGDYRVIQQRIKKLEKLLTIHNISIPGENKSKDPYRLKKKYSTKLEDLDYFPLDFCRQYLRDISCELEVDDLEQVVSEIQRLREQLDTSSKYEKFCRNTQEILHGMEAEQRKDRQSPKIMKRKSMQALSENQLQNLISTVEKWREDQAGLEELQVSLNKLGEKVAPWLKIKLTGETSVSRLLAAVDNLLYDDGIVREKNGKEHPSRTVLENIVQHFQTLFDVPSVSGVFPRMNDIYTKLGEVHNVLHTLRDLLGLDYDAKSGDIVDSVGRLCQSHSNTTSKQLKALLQTEDLDGVIRRLEEHSRFFPAFKEIMNKLLDILDVQRMDQVIPAVRALKLLAT